MRKKGWNDFDLDDAVVTTGAKKASSPLTPGKLTPTEKASQNNSPKYGNVSAKFIQRRAIDAARGQFGEDEMIEADVRRMRSSH